MVHNPSLDVDGSGSSGSLCQQDSSDNPRRLFSEPIGPVYKFSFWVHSMDNANLLNIGEQFKIIFKNVNYPAIPTDIPQLGGGGTWYKFEANIPGLIFDDIVIMRPNKNNEEFSKIYCYDRIEIFGAPEICESLNFWSKILNGFHSVSYECTSCQL